MPPTRFLALAVLLGLTVSSASPIASAGALADRVRVLEDQQAIRAVLIQYGDYLDAQDYGHYAALFAKDGVWTGGYGTATGPAAIQALMEKSMGKPAPGFINRTKFHLMATEQIAVTGDTATVRSRFTVFTADADGRPAPSRAGRYVDAFVREPGGWRIKRRTTYGIIPYSGP
ncbi:nuclear transport factor 2 family protein [Sphingobium nicotianae]|uniref:Nuclear transport factor 2 family protein n=1 Tax=Sphingobium nicotianae TaxID=2782607 RepID=A0A9X1IT98_9SPHN|nr:nuclear transport factor 2 family protein [Sphingobium nicotianae]MBT2189105.1 nuclear transport factor 2 family protein [Sphingobium nicotianae]